MDILIGLVLVPLALCFVSVNLWLVAKLTGLIP